MVENKNDKISESRWKTKLRLKSHDKSHDHVIIQIPHDYNIISKLYYLTLIIRL